VGAYYKLSELPGSLKIDLTRRRAIAGGGVVVLAAGYIFGTVAYFFCDGVSSAYL
jgi:hypothetical protein